MKKSQSENELSRRDFIKTTGVTTAAFAAGGAGRRREFRLRLCSAVRKNNRGK
jgi:hypothetical protein